MHWVVQYQATVENSIINKYGNRFLEGSNSRLKMIKRAIYGNNWSSIIESYNIKVALFLFFRSNFRKEPHFAPEYSS